MGAISEIAYGFRGYDGMIPRSTATVAEVLRLHGYGTAMFGKAHVTPMWETSAAGPFERWPTGLGFDRFYGFLGAETSKYEPAPCWIRGSLSRVIPSWRDGCRLWKCQRTERRVGGHPVSGHESSQRGVGEKFVRECRRLLPTPRPARWSDAVRAGGIDHLQARPRAIARSSTRFSISRMWVTRSPFQTESDQMAGQAGVGVADIRSVNDAPLT